MCQLISTVQLCRLGDYKLFGFTKQGKKLRLKKDTDDLSCMVFSTANTVTLMYYSLCILTGGRVDENENKVPWVAYSVHILNTLVAWSDVLISYPRRFGNRSRNWTLVFSVVYVIWINWIRLQSGRFPYPFLDSLPYPYGVIVVGVLGALIMRLFIFIGGIVSRLGFSLLANYEETDPVWEVIENVESFTAKKLMAVNIRHEDIKVK